MAPARVEARLRRLAAIRGRLLVVADFDGTLADFHPDPMGAFVAPGARPVLRRLARIAAAHPGRLTVVLLSGRVALDVAVRVRVGGVRYLGNHGNESGVLDRGRPAEALRVVIPDRLLAFVPAAERLGAAVAAGVARHAGTAVPPAWLFVEPKGPAVAFHYRQAPDALAAGRLIDAAIDDAARAALTDGFTRIDSRLIVEFQPIGAGAKGEALERLLAELVPDAVLVLGDDRPDAEAFAAVHAARRTGRLADALAVAVRHGRPLAPEVAATADAVVDGTRAATGLLRTLADALEEGAR